MTCPSGEALLAFHWGELGETDIAAIGAHLAACMHCEQQARQLDSLNDAALSALRGSGDRQGPAWERGPYPTLPPPSGPAPDIPGYETLGLVGRGGMGLVWKARDRRLDRLVALKCVRTDNGPALERIQAEAQAVARLSHPNIVQIFEVGEWQGQPFLALEYLAGGTLADQLNGKPQDARTSVTLVHTLAGAVQHAHTQGIVHRDLKPANILLQKDEGGRMKDEKASHDSKSDFMLHPSSFLLPKIADFGIAKHLQASGQTREGDICGTARYMAPEQAVGKSADVGPASDIYSLGVILYEMLTGRVPLQGATDLDTVLLVQKEEPVSPRRLQPGLPRDLETICLKCLHKEPGQRYRSAQDLADDLGRMLAGEPIAARPASPWERAWKWARRRPTAAALILLGALMISVGFPGVTYLWLQAEDARVQETVQREKADRAAEAEKEASQKAQLSAAEAQALFDFLEQRILFPASAKNFGGLGPKGTLRQALDAALPFVETNFPDQPLMEARLRITLVRAFQTQGDKNSAVKQMEKVRAIYLAHWGPEHRETLSASNSVISFYRALKRTAEAVQLAEETLAVEKTTVGMDHPETLHTMELLAHAYCDSVASRPDGVRLRTELLALRTAKLGKDHNDTLRTLEDLASDSAALGRHDDALKLRTELLALRTAKLGKDHGDTLRTLEGLAKEHATLGRHDDALKLREELVSRWRAAGGPDHPETIRCVSMVAAAYMSGDRGADAVKLHQDFLTLCRDQLGPNHVNTLDGMYRLAKTYSHLKRHAEAHTLYEELFARRQATHGPDDPQTLGAMNFLAGSLAALGKHDEAFQLREERLALLETKLGADHDDTRRNRHDIAASYSKQGRYRDARRHYEELLRSETREGGPDRAAALVTLNLLADTYTKTGQRTEVVKLIQAQLTLQKAKHDPDNDSTRRMMRELAKIYLWNGLRTESVKLCEQALALYEAKVGPDHADTHSARRDLASYYTLVGRYGEALKLHQQDLALRQAKLGPDHADTLSSMSAVAFDLVKLGRGAEALPIIDDCLKRAAGQKVDPQLIPRLMARRMEHFQRAQDVAGCRETADMWEALKRTDADSLYSAARMRAALAGAIRATDKRAGAQASAAAEADRAMAWLRQALAAGYRRSASLKLDSVLEPLRDREDFQKLLAGRK